MCIRDRFITDYDCYVGGLYDKLGEYANLDELNYLAAKLDDMDRSEYNQFLAAMETVSYTHLGAYRPGGSPAIRKEAGKGGGRNHPGRIGGKAVPFLPSAIFRGRKG